MVMKYVPSREGIGEASVLAVADPIIEKAAEQILEKARELATEQGFTEYADSLSITEGTRPKGRGFREIIADDPQGEALEWGDNSTVRRRILGQAAGVQVNLKGDA